MQHDNQNLRTKKSNDKGVNYALIKRNLMLRDTDGDLSRFKQQTIVPRNRKPEKYKKNYLDLQD